MYTDGSSRSRPRTGGVGFKLKFPQKCGKEDRRFSSPGYKMANNNQSELQACILAIKEARRFLKKNKCFKKIIIFTDCQYIVNNCDNAKYRWSNNGWRKIGGAPIANVSLWKELISNLRNIGMTVLIKKVKGHAKDEDNKDVDRIAKRSSKRKAFNSLIPTIARRKLSPRSVQKSSVRMKNQEILIRIVTFLEVVKKEHRYKYEVVDEKSNYYQCVDEIYSKKILKPAHTYLVKVNDNQEYPQVVGVIKEIEKD